MSLRTCSTQLCANCPEDATSVGINEDGRGGVEDGRDRQVARVVVGREFALVNEGLGIDVLGGIVPGAAGVPEGVAGHLWDRGGVLSGALWGAMGHFVDRFVGGMVARRTRDGGKAEKQSR